MLKLLLVASDKDSLSRLVSVLETHDDVELLQTESGENALKMVTDKAIDLVVTDENLGDMTGLEFVSRLVSLNPMLNCAVVSSLSPKEFHEASEGLGIMAQLPVPPGERDAEKLLKDLKNLKSLVSNI